VEVEHLNRAAYHVLNFYEELGHLQRRLTHLPRFFDQIPHTSLAAPRLRYACLHLDEDVRLHNVHDRVHAVLHGLNEPLLRLLRLIGVALDDQFIVADENRYVLVLLVLVPIPIEQLSSLIRAAPDVLRGARETLLGMLEPLSDLGLLLIGCFLGCS
jgi:hypothetical protein